MDESIAQMSCTVNGKVRVRVHRFGRFRKFGRTLLLLHICVSNPSRHTEVFGDTESGRRRSKMVGRFVPHRRESSTTGLSRCPAESLLRIRHIATKASVRSAGRSGIDPYTGSIDCSIFGKNVES